MPVQRRRGKIVQGILAFALTLFFGLSSDRGQLNHFGALAGGALATAVLVQLAREARRPLSRWRVVRGTALGSWLGGAVGGGFFDYQGLGESIGAGLIPALFVTFGCWKLVSGMYGDEAPPPETSGVARLPESDGQTLASAAGPSDPE